MRSPYLAPTLGKQDGVLKLHIEAFQSLLLAVYFLFELGRAAGHHTGNKLKGNTRNFL